MANSQHSNLIVERASSALGQLVRMHAVHLHTGLGVLVPHQIVVDVLQIGQLHHVVALDAVHAVAELFQPQIVEQRLPIAGAQFVVLFDVVEIVNGPLEDAIVLIRRTSALALDPRRPVQVDL